MSLHNRKDRNAQTAAERRKRDYRNLARVARTPAMEELENRTHRSATVESVDGTGNNIANTLWGSAGTDLLRLAAAAYADGVSSPNLPADLSARAISNILNNQADPANPSADAATIDKNSLSDYGYAFGQFMDHDLDLTPDGGVFFNVPVAADDPMGPQPLYFTRSATAHDFAKFGRNLRFATRFATRLSGKHHSS